MQHLKYLAIFNYVLAAMQALSGLALALLALASGGLGLSSGDDLASSMIPMVGLGVLAVVLFAIAGLLVYLGRQVSRARGRILQTIMAVLTITSVPFGTAYAVYALWLCWMNEETKKAFDEPYGLVG